jgi:hypothetical protein
VQVLAELGEVWWSEIGWSVVKCSGVLQCSDGLSNKVSNIIKRLMDNMKLLLVCILLLSCSSHSLGSIFINVHMVLFLFNNVIYVFLLLWLCILVVCLCMATLTEFFLCFFLSCKANARVKLAKTGHGSHSFLIFVLFCVLLVLFRFLYCLCVYVCTVLLPLGSYPIAVNP